MRVVEQIRLVMPSVLLERKPEVRSRRRKAERVSRGELRVLCDLPKVEAVHQVGCLANGNGAWHLALWQTKVMHATGIIVRLVANQGDPSAVDVERRAGQQREPPLPRMSYSR